MKRTILLLIITSTLILSGCGSHYYQKNDDTISIFLKKPNARQVYFLSSLDGYKPRKAARVDEETWQINVRAKTEFRYFYKVDGSEYLPACRLKEQDDFGSKICIYIPGL